MRYNLLSCSCPPYDSLVNRSTITQAAPAEVNAPKSEMEVALFYSLRDGNQVNPKTLSAFAGVSCRKSTAAPPWQPRDRTARASRACFSSQLIKVSVTRGSPVETRRERARQTRAVYITGKRKLLTISFSLAPSPPFTLDQQHGKGPRIPRACR